MIATKVNRGRPLTVHIGERYGMLVVVARVQNGPRRQVRFLCRCDCGREVEVLSLNLRSGKTRSCGCLRKERMRLAARTAGRITAMLTGEE
jgi:hypothetical protein